MTAAAEARVRIAADHPALDGHFPGRPVVPAVVLLAEAFAAIEAATGRAPHDWTLVAAKFLRAVEPGSVLQVRHEQTSARDVRFEIRCGGEVVASGRLACA
jgi:3-hydroxymyristoyl/3-hydroxydecanoyl-(acyl carrier protein) dehydratase